MTTSQSFVRAGVLALGLLTLSSANAQDPSGSQWGLGAVVGLQRKPYRDFDDKAQVLPFVFYESRWFRVAGTTADLKLKSNAPLTAGLRVRYAGDGYEADDSPFLAGMAEREGSFWAGGNASWRTNWATFTAEVLGDASGKSKGTRMSLGIERRFATGDFDFTPSLTVHSFDKNYVDYYYGVRTDEATTARTTYFGKSATNVEAGLRIGYAIAPKQRLFLDLSSTRLGSSIKDSPLVDKSQQDSVRAGYLYQF